MEDSKLGIIKVEEQPLPLPSLLLNTKGHCFICLKFISVGQGGTQSLRCLCRYLNISLDKLLTSAVASDVGLFGGVKSKLDLRVPLCQLCRDNLGKINQIVQMIEEMRMKLNYWMDTVNEAISESDFNLKGDYEKRLGDECLSHLEITRELRKKLLNKCEREKTEAKLILERVKLTPSHKKSKEFLKSKAKLQKIKDNGLQISDGGRTRCKSCWREYSSVYKFVRHFKVAHLKVEHRCQHCDEVLFCKEFLQRHETGCLQNPNRKSFKCEKCPKSFTNKPALTAHFRAYHLGEKNRYICEYCQAKYKYSQNLIRHKRTCLVREEAEDLSETEAPSVPKVEDKVEVKAEAVGEKSLEKNERELIKKEASDSCNVTVDANGSKQFGCKLCLKICTTFSTFYSHYRRFHIKGDFNCLICNNRSFSTRAQLYTHTATCRNSKNFPCNLCPNSYASKKHLARHTSGVHLKLKPFKCLDCGQAFTLNYSLLRHKRQSKCVQRDVSKRKYFCKVCGNGYTNLKAMQRHYNRVHLRKGRAQCEICEKSFACNQFLRSHMEVLHQLKFHCGGGCRKSFADQEALDFHKNTDHVKDDVEVEETSEEILGS